MPLIDIQLFNG